MSTFIKSYTRDNGLIIQEPWDKHYCRDFDDNKNPYFPPQVNHIHDGVVEIWENEESIKWFTDRLFEKNTREPAFLTRFIENHLAIADELQSLAEKPHLESVEDLQKFIDLLDRGTYTFLAFYYSAVDERTPPDIRDAALAVREKDAFYDIADRLIRKTLEYLHPHTKGCTIGIVRNEIENPPSREILEARFENSVMAIDGTLETVGLEAYASQHPEFTFTFDNIPSGNELHGQCGMRGRARGKVRVLKRKTQIGELEEGEVLVSSMTTPDFIPAMKKSAAIVTDEGGITCHAAIVARELKKPCVTGTKVATKMFKDGDMVEVDAEKGVVTVVERI